MNTSFLMKILWGQYFRNIQTVFLKIIKVTKMKDKEDLRILH